MVDFEQLTADLFIFMKRETTVEIFAEESNFVVLRVPGRKYPGVLIQGDSLSGIVGDLEQAINLFETDKEESLGCLKLAYDGLKWRLNGYIQACEDNSEDLPFSKS